MMYKQECLEILNQKIDEAQEETDRSPEGSSYGTLMLGRKQAFSDVRGLLKTLNEPENPEIPAELAKKIENFKGKVTDDYIIYSIFLDDEYDNLKKDTRQWIKDNPGKLSRAVVNGYTIEKAPVWVTLKDAQYFHAFTGEYDKFEGFEYVLAVYEEHAHTFTDKQKAEAVATLVDGTVEEWSE